MSRFHAVRLIMLLSAVAVPAVARAADPPAAAGKAPMARTFVATGPTAAADLVRLRAAVANVAGVVNVEVRVAPDGATTLSITGPESATPRMLAAAAKSAGFVLRPAPTRSFSVAGPTGAADLILLREALGKVPGVDQVELSRLPIGAALRVTGVATSTVLTAAGKTAGFALRQMGAYAASGSSVDGDLARLRGVLKKAPGVEQVELQGLAGGATVLIYGDVQDPALAVAAKAEGYVLWPLANAAGPREFRLSREASPTEFRRLREVLQSLDGIGELEIRSAPDGPRLVVTGGRARPAVIAEAASAAGFALTALEAVSLPSLTPQAGRNTPSDLDDERALGDQAKPGEPAPDFTLLTNDGEKRIRLSEYRRKKPVVLMFGSCT